MPFKKEFILLNLFLVSFAFAGTTTKVNVEVTEGNSEPLEMNIEGQKWDVFSSRFCTIFYESNVNLKLVNRNINLKYQNYYGLWKVTGEVELPTKEVLAGKFDTIFIRVEEILDMFPPKIHVTFNIYKDRDGLDNAYEEIFNEPNTALSFYIYKTNTIYTTESAINENILAHEIAHCIIDHYFVILPPVKIQEILAAYADMHLKD